MFNVLISFGIIFLVGQVAEFEFPQNKSLLSLSLGWMAIVVLAILLFTAH